MDRQSAGQAGAGTAYGRRDDGASAGVVSWSDRRAPARIIRTPLLILVDVQRE